ncbi:MAG: hypothetical protein N3E50_06110 [Candidatus Goldbacteria bacterium]|nr:hypothetical protein [Candidatus Goldiibacteriota bacterium]
MKKILILYLLFLNIHIFAKDEKINIPLPNPTIKVLYTIPGADVNASQEIFEIKPTPEFNIDGIFNEQIKTHPIIIRDSKCVIIAKIYFSYNNNGIYLFADIIDKSPGLNKNTKENINKGDSIELFFNFGRMYHIGIKAADKKELWNWTLQSNVDRDDTCYKKTKNGYVIETQIPWHNFMMGCLCSLRNKELEFNVIINNLQYNNKLIKYKFCEIQDDEIEKGCRKVVFR